MTRNKARELLRRKPPPTLADSGLWASLADPNAGPVSDVADYRTELMAQALHLMSGEFQPNTWQAFWQTAILGRAANAVAADLGMTPNAVYLAKFRVLARLKRELRGLWE